MFAPDSAADERLKYSPYLDAIGAYVGLPINDESGHLFGSFCHYDFCSQPADDQEFEFLEEAVRLLGPFCERR